MPQPEVLVNEVGPRDGLRSLSRPMATAARRAGVDALHAAGLRESEVASLVPPTPLPQMAGAAEVVHHAITKPGLTVAAPVPNPRGAEAALVAGTHKLEIPVPASRAHALANVRRTRAPMVDEVRRIAALRAAAGVNDAGLSGTTGVANPAQVSSLSRRLRPPVADRTGAAHLHTTCGLGPANGLAASDVGARTFDASLGGPGRYPCAPGAPGHVVPDDRVFMFEAMGVATGADLVRLIAIRGLPRAALPGEPVCGMRPEAGPPKGFVQAGSHG